MANILLIDDEDDLRDNVEVVLTHDGHTVKVATNGRDGLGMILDSPPDLVVCDVSMPVMGGLELVRTLRKEQPDLADLPFIFLSAFSDRETIMAGRDAGADEFLVKPIDYALLRATINSRLQRAKQTAALKEKQFVRLFKNLTQFSPDITVNEPDKNYDMVRRISELDEIPLSGRLEIFVLEDIILGWSDIPRSTQDKIIAVFERLLHTYLTDEDIYLQLGRSSWMVMLLHGDVNSAASSFATLRSGISTAIGALKYSLAPDGDCNKLVADAESGVNFRELIHKVERQEHRQQPGGFGFHFNDMKNIFRIEYSPIWNAQTQTIESCKLCIQRRLRDVWGPDGQVLLAGSQDPWLCDMQHFILETAICDIMALKADSALQGRVPSVIIPLSLHAFMQMETFKIEKQLHDISRLLSPNDFGFLLVDFDDTVPPHELRHVVRKLIPLSHNLAIDMNFRHAMNRELKSMGIRYIRADLDDMFALGFGREIVTRMVGEFLKASLHLGLSPWLSNVHTVADVKLSLSGGCHFISGRTIGEPHNQPCLRSRLAQSKIVMMI